MIKLTRYTFIFMLVVGLLASPIGVQAAGSDVYVDASWAGTTPGADPDGAGPAQAFGTDAFATIQEGVDNVDPGGFVHVAAGIYQEEPIIAQALTLLGPNAGLNPNTDVRGAEAVVQPITEGTDPNADCTVILYVGADNVTIDGFTIDGNNPGLTSGVLVNGVDVDACEGIAGYDTHANISVENNIVTNTTYTGIDFDNYFTPGATSENFIRYNLLDNIGNSTIGYGIGVLVYDNFYADITNNVFTDVRVGIQTGNFSLPNPGGTGVIGSNEIHSWRAGIFHNLFYSGASDYPLTDNQIQVIDSSGTTRWNGILLTSFSVPTTVYNNTITATDVTQQTVGYMVWNDMVPAGLSISGGTVTNADYGIWVNNYEGYGPSNSGPTSIAIDGVTISGASLAGIYVQDDPQNSNFSTVDATITGSQISGSTVAVKIDGSDASANGSFNQFAGNVDGVINTTSTLLDFPMNWWGDSSGPGPVGPGTGDSVSTDVNFTPWCGDSFCSFFAPSPLTALTIEQSPTGSAPWSPVFGDLNSGYLLSLNGVPTDFVYLNVDSLTVNTTLQNGYHPFMLDTTSLPAGYYEYWDALGVNASATPGTWQAEMYQIIQGNDPIFYLKVVGTTYTLVDGLGYNMGLPDGYLQISGDYPLGSYTFNGMLSDTTGANYLTTVEMTLQPLPEITALTIEQSPTGSAPWSPVFGDLNSGFLLSLNGVPTDFVYLNVDSLTVNTTLQDGYHPFTLDTTSLPAGYYEYWDALGVNVSATPGTWQAEMYQIILGNDPIFYLKVAGTTYTLVDGLGYNMGQPDGYLRISGDYPLGSYAFNGVLTDTTGATNTMSAGLTINAITYTISGNAGVAGATLSYTDGSPQTATADGSGDYSFSVSYNWTGTVTPSLTGYTFSPDHIDYANVLTDLTGQDYTATAITYAISGNAGVEFATLSYDDGGPQTATADASGNYSFTVSYDWTGTVTPSKDGYTFSPDHIDYANVLADQTGQNYTATAILYTLTITSDHGTVAKSPDQVTYHYGDVVDLTATADAGYTFANWSGDATGTTNPVSITINGDTSVTANYTQDEYTLTITSDHGTVAKSPDQVTYHFGDVVQLTATADAGYTFANWSGDATGTTNPVSVTMNGNRSVTANYTQDEYTLTITSDHGTVAKSPDQVTYHFGDVVDLTATADTGYTFANWSGDATGTTNPVSVTMDANKSVTANYSIVALDHTISGNAGVAGALVSYTGGSTTADGSGVYTFTVPDNWTGTVTPSRMSYVFTPDHVDYANVQADQTGQNYTATAVATFADVPTNYWAWSWIEGFYTAGITNGCGLGPLIYCPERQVTRAEMAVFILRAKYGASYVPPASTGIFADVPVAGKEWMQPWIEQFYRDGITTGCAQSPLQYCPERNVTRAEMAVFLLRALNGTSYVPPASTGIFSDVPVAGKEWMQPWIEQFYRDGFTTGCAQSPLRYCPEQSTTRAEMAVFIDRVYNIPIP
jgi:uncharacterized repeat protein (TIGR02543 family)